MKAPASLHLPTIAFDLDGTLADTAADIVRAINAMLIGAGVGPLSHAEAVELINLGAGARNLIGKSFEAAGRPLDAQSVEAMVIRYLDCYLANVAVDSRLFPGCHDALQVLRQRGHRLVVCTNKPERHARLVLEALGIASLFEVIAGIDTYPYCKPDGRHLAMAIEAAGGDVRHAVMLGDSHVDVSAARDAGVPVVCVSFGYTAVPVAELGADATIDGFDELVDVLDRLVPRRSEPSTPEGSLRAGAD